MLRRFALPVLLLTLAGILTVFPVLAGEDKGAAFTLDCTGFTGTAGEIMLNRDNTGAGREAFIVSATDGAGKTIYAPVTDQFFVGGTISWVDGGRIGWTSAPTFNPLTLRIVSRAGNDLGESLILLATGQCSDLPNVTALPDEFFRVEGDDLVAPGGATAPAGTTSLTVPLNTSPPRPTNPDAVSQVLPGYLLVNTDNLSVRTGPAPSFTLVAVVDGGTELIPLGRTADFTWWYVQAGNVIGWASAEFLLARGDLRAVPVVPERGVEAPVTFITFSETVLFSGPGEETLPFCTLPGSVEYRVIGRDARSNWYEIQATCDNAVVNGWIFNEQGAIRNPARTFIEVTTGN
jgi:uncharacterized protein YgiM (DUF1202 family)